MIKRKYINLAAGALIAIGGVGLLGTALALSGWLGLTPESRAEAVLYGSLTVLIAYSAAMLLGWVRREQRRRAYRRGQAAWKRCDLADDVSALARVAAAAQTEREIDRERRGEAAGESRGEVEPMHQPRLFEIEALAARLEELSVEALRRLAGQAYQALGYEILGGEDRAGWLRLGNPDGEIELAVVCAGTPADAGLVVDMQEEMHRVASVHGYIWSPTGFTEGARRWGKNRPIVLADGLRILQFVESAGVEIEKKSEGGRKGGVRSVKFGVRS